MKVRRFLLSSEDCELLLEFELCNSIASVAKKMHRDPSGVSRQLSKISSAYPAVEKRQGKWVLTEIGKRLNSYSRDMIQMQKQLIEDEFVLRIGANREFAAKIIAPSINNIQKIFSNTRIVLHTFEHGVEKALLCGQIDLGFDCGRPHDPDISYKRLINEPIIAVCTKKFYKKNIEKIDDGLFIETPHLLCERLHPDKILGKESNKINPVASFNDISVTREICLQSLGWALLPKYTVQSELNSGKLIEYTIKNCNEEKYGVWWLRNRVFPEGLVKSMCSWLKEQKL